MTKKEGQSCLFGSSEEKYMLTKRKKMNKLQLNVSSQLQQNLPSFPNSINSIHWQKVTSEAKNSKIVDSLMAPNGALVQVGLPVQKCHDANLLFSYKK